MKPPSRPAPLPGSVTTHHLEAFIAVASTLNFGRASESLFMTQSSLSRRIQTLETALGVTLFERTTRTVRMTVKGTELLPLARALVEAVRDGAVLAQSPAAGKELIRVFHTAEGSAQATKLGLLLRAASQGIEIRQFEGALPSGHTHMASARGAVRVQAECEHTDHQALLLDDDPVVALVGSDHPLFGRPVLGVGELASAKLRAMNAIDAPGLRGVIGEVGLVCDESGTRVDAAADGAVVLELASRVRQRVPHAERTPVRGIRAVRFCASADDISTRRLLHAALAKAVSGT